MNTSWRKSMFTTVYYLATTWLDETWKWRHIRIQIFCKHLGSPNLATIAKFDDIVKIGGCTQLGRGESGWHFSVEYRHHLRPWMDGIVGKTYKTYNSLPPCQEIDISCHKLSQNDDFVSSSVAAILKPRFRDHVTPIFQPTPISDMGT